MTVLISLESTTRADVTQNGGRCSLVPAVAVVVHADDVDVFCVCVCDVDVLVCPRHQFRRRAAAALDCCDEETAMTLNRDPDLTYCRRRHGDGCIQWAADAGLY